MKRRRYGCGAYKECAYWAWTIFVSPDDKQKKALCSNCCRLYKLDGWREIK